MDSLLFFRFTIKLIYMSSCIPLQRIWPLASDLLNYLKYKYVHIHVYGLLSEFIALKRDALQQGETTVQQAQIECKCFSFVYKNARNESVLEYIQFRRHAFAKNKCTCFSFLTVLTLRRFTRFSFGIFRTDKLKLTQHHS